MRIHQWKQPTAVVISIEVEAVSRAPHPSWELVQKSRVWKRVFPTWDDLCAFVEANAGEIARVRLEESRRNTEHPKFHVNLKEAASLGIPCRKHR